MESVVDLKSVLEKIMDALAVSFGNSCEVVLHDLKGKAYEHSIIAIRNGHITNRKVGDSSTNKGLEFVRHQDRANGDQLGYITKTKNGKTLRSSSIYFRNSENQVIGSLCINLDISQFLVAENSLRNLLGLDAVQVEPEKNEFFASDINTLLQDLIQSSMEHVGKPSSLMSKDEKRIGIGYLDERGTFLIKKSSEQVCSSYGISKNALYSFLDEIRKPRMD